MAPHRMRHCRSGVAVNKYSRKGYEKLARVHTLVDLSLIVIKNVTDQVSLVKGAFIGKC